MGSWVGDTGNEVISFFGLNDAKRRLRAVCDGVRRLDRQVRRSTWVDHFADQGILASEMLGVTTACTVRIGLY